MTERLAFWLRFLEVAAGVTAAAAFAVAGDLLYRGRYVPGGALAVCSMVLAAQAVLIDRLLAEPPK